MGLKMFHGIHRIFSCYKLQHCSQRFSFRAASNLNDFVQSGSRGFIKPFKHHKRHHLVKFFLGHETCIKSHNHVQTIFTRCNKLLEKYSLFWTFKYTVPFHTILILLWYSSPYLKNYLNGIVLCGECASALSLIPTLPVQNNQQTVHSSQIVSTVCSVREFVLTFLRAAHLLVVFIPLLLIYPLTHISPGCFNVWLHLLYAGVEHSGATFIKLCQWASTRRDLFSKEFCDLFSCLHHKVRPHSWSHTARVLNQAYGENWQQMLHLSVGQEPIGSGCIAQVYKGYITPDFAPLTVLESLGKVKSKVNSLKDTAKTVHRNDDTGVSESMDPRVDSEKNLIPVAIKVLHPNIREKFCRDLRLMKAAAKCLTTVFPRLHWVNLNQCVQEFSISMDKQLDMHYECQCLQKFVQDFQSFARVKVPQPIPFLVRQNILVETFEEGVSMCQILTSTDHSLQLKKELAAMGLDLLLQMIFVNNFVHADLHPGNLLVQNIEHFKPEKEVIPVDVWKPIVMDLSPAKQLPLKLVMLDCGITTSLAPEDRSKFIDVFTAVVRGQGEVVADLFLSKSPVNQCTDPDIFRKEMAQLVAKGRQNLRSVSKIRVAELMNELFTVLSRHKIQLDSSFVTVVLAIAMLEGLGRTLDPNLDLMDRAKSVLLGRHFKR